MVGFYTNRPERLELSNSCQGNLILPRVLPKHVSSAEQQSIRNTFSRVDDLVQCIGAAICEDAVPRMSVPWMMYSFGWCGRQGCEEYICDLARERDGSRDWRIRRRSARFNAVPYAQYHHDGHVRAIACPGPRWEETKTFLIDFT